MPAPHPLTRPLPLRQLPPELANAESEIADLSALASAGLPLAAIVVVPAAVEERFYRYNNLPEQLMQLFAAVDVDRPDEDDVEEASPAAQELVRQHYLMDETIDDFYAATAGLVGRVCVRRPGGTGLTTVAGRPALLAVKHLFRSDWSFDAVWDRLERRASVALDARPVLVHEAPAASAPAELVARAAEVLGYAVSLRTTSAGAIVGVERT